MTETYSAAAERASEQPNWATSDLCSTGFWVADVPLERLDGVLFDASASARKVYGARPASGAPRPRRALIHLPRDRA